MTAKRINSLLTAAAIACGAIAVLALVTGALLPIDSANFPDAQPSALAAAHSHSPSTATAFDSQNALWSRSFRASMTDTAPGTASPEAAAAPSAAGNAQSLSLVGTIGDSLALIRLPDGSVVARAVGDDVVGSGSVVAISPRGVELSINGQRVLLAKPQPATSSGVVIERAS